MDAGNPAALHWRCRIAVMIEAPAQLVGSAPERGKDIALPDAESADEIGRETVVKERRVGTQCRLRIDHGGPRIEAERHELCRLFRGKATFCHDNGDRFPDMADLVISEQRLLRI